MVRRVGNDTINVNPDGSFEGEGDQIGIDPDTAANYEQFRADAQGEHAGYMVWVFYVPTDKDGAPFARGKLENLFTAPVDQYTVDQILSTVRSEWMTKTDLRWLVRIQIREPATHAIKFNQLFIVRKNPSEKSTEDRTSQSQLGEVMEAVRKLMADGQQRTDALLQRLAEKTAAPAVDPVNLMLMAQQQSTQMFAVIAAAMRGNDSKGGVDQLTSMIGAMRAIKGLGDDLAGGNSHADEGFAGLVRTLAPLAVPLVQAAISRPPVQRIAAPAIPTASSGVAGTPAPAAGAAAAPSPPIAAVPPTALEILEREKMLEQLRAALGLLADTAASRPDPKQTAGELLEQLPNEMDDMIYTTLAADNWFEQLSLWQPKIAMHREWFTLVRNEMLASFHEGPLEGANDATH